MLQIHNVSDQGELSRMSTIRDLHSHVFSPGYRLSQNM